MKWMLTNSRGRPDFLMTAAVLSLGTVLLKVLVGGLTYTGKLNFDLGPIPDAGVIAAILTPTFAAYTIKRIKAPTDP